MFVARVVRTTNPLDWPECYSCGHLLALHKAHRCRVTECECDRFPERHAHEHRANRQRFEQERA